MGKGDKRGGGEGERQDGEGMQEGRGEWERQDGEDRQEGRGRVLERYWRHFGVTLWNTGKEEISGKLGTYSVLFQFIQLRARVSTMLNEVSTAAAAI